MYSHIANDIIGLSDEAQRKCIQQLYPGDYESFKDLNVDRTLGTCEWLLQHDRYTAWREDEHSSVLWISANAGCGKSTLAKYLIDHLRSTNSSNRKPESVCHFFFKEGIQKQQSASLAIRAILHQIFARDEYLRRHLFKEYELKENKIMEEYDTLFKIFRNVVQDPESPNIVCIFDGADECPKESLMQLLKDIDKLMEAQAKIAAEKEAQGGYWSLPTLKVMVLSRPENSIKNAFNKRQHTIRLKGEDETKAINHDISIVIKQFIKDLNNSGIPSGVLKGFSEGLERGADNTFLWVTLMLKILKDRHESSGGVSQHELLELLRSRDIFAVYRHMLRKINLQDDSYKMLHIIIAAQTPLSIVEISVALACSLSHKTLEDIAKDIKFPQEDYVKTLCGHFVRFIRGKVHLVHQTAREFLLQEGPRQQSGNRGGSYDIWQHPMDAIDSHRTLLRSCISYLNCGERSSWDDAKSLHDPEFHSVTEDEISKLLASDEDEEGGPLEYELKVRKREKTSILPELTEFERLSQTHPFLEYSASSWTLHFTLSRLRPSTRLFSQVMELCRPIPESPNELDKPRGTSHQSAEYTSVIPESRYPSWTLERTMFARLGGACWEAGRTLGPAEQRARIIFGLQLDDLAIRFCEQHGNDTTAQMSSMLISAAGMGSFSACIWLMKYGADVNAVDEKSGHTPLSSAIQSCRPKVAEFLVSKGALLNPPIYGGDIQCAHHCRTGLHCAVKFRCHRVVKLLMESGGDAEAEDSKGRTPLWYITRSNQRHVIQLLLLKLMNIITEDVS